MQKMLFLLKSRYRSGIMLIESNLGVIIDIMLKDIII